MNYRIEKVGEVESGIQWENLPPETKTKHVALKVISNSGLFKKDLGTALISHKFYNAINEDLDLRNDILITISFAFQDPEKTFNQLMTEMEKQWKREDEKEV